jgi:hypothetical protein
MLEEYNVEAVELCVPWTETASEVTVRNQQWKIRAPLPFGFL